MNCTVWSWDRTFLIQTGHQSTKDHKKVQRKTQSSKRDAEPAAGWRDGHGGHKGTQEGTRADFRCVRAAGPEETNEEEERTQKLLWGEGVTSRDVLTNPEGYKAHSRDSSVLRWSSRASGWETRGKKKKTHRKIKKQQGMWQMRKKPKKLE